MDYQTSAPPVVGAAGNARRARTGHASHKFRATQGLTVFESSIMDLYEAGASINAIAETTGKQIGTIRKVIHTFADNNDEQRARTAAAMGSQRLLIAQLRAGQHQLPAFIAIQRAAELAASGAVRR